MIADLWTVVWKEWKEWFDPGGRPRDGIWHDALVIVGALGIFIAAQSGRAWVDSGIVLYWMWLPLLQMGNVIADSFAGERERRTLETLLASRLSDRAILFGKIAAAVLYGWALTLVSLLVGLVTVNIGYARDDFLVYPPGIALGVIVLSFLGALFVAGGGVLISLRSGTVRVAYQRLSIAVLVLFLPVFSLQYLPDQLKPRLGTAPVGLDLALVELAATAVLIVLDLAVLAAARAWFRRARLILD